MTLKLIRNSLAVFTILTIIILACTKCNYAVGQALKQQQKKDSITPPPTKPYYAILTLQDCIYTDSLLFNTQNLLLYSDLPSKQTTNLNNQIQSLRNYITNQLQSIKHYNDSVITASQKQLTDNAAKHK